MFILLFKNMKKVLVTGAAGYIGSNLVEYLLSKDYEVVGLDNFNEYYSPKVKRFNIETFKNHKNFKLYEIDLVDKDALTKMFDEEKEFYSIIHLAAWAGVTYSVKHPDIYIKANVEGSHNLMDLASKRSVGSFIFASTSSIYGDNKVPFDETMNTDRPNAPYPASKKSVEVLLYTYNKNFGLKTTIFRFFNPLGPRIRPDMALPKLIRATLYDYEFPIYQNPENSKRDYTYIGHMLDAIEKAMDKQFEYEIINLGNSNPVSLIDMMKSVERTIGKKAKTKQLPLPGQMHITYANIDKAKRLLEYNPNTTLDEMIQIYYEWFLKQPEWYRKIKIEV